MRAIAEIEVLSLGDESQRALVQRACELLDEADLTVNMHAMGTNVEGELYSVLLAVQKLHLTLHTDGVERVSSRMTIETRSDKVPELDDRVEA